VDKIARVGGLVGTKCQVRDTMYQVPGPRYLIRDTRYHVPGNLLDKLGGDLILALYLVCGIIKRILGPVFRLYLA